MAVKRLITNTQKEKIKNLKKYKRKTISQLSNQEKDDLLEIIANKLNLL